MSKFDNFVGNSNGYREHNKFKCNTDENTFPGYY